MHQDEEIRNMIDVIDHCLNSDKKEFLAALIVKIQTEYKEIAELSTDGEYQVTWTHNDLLDYLTYQSKK
ncbi:MAG: hypothetical protein EB127_29590 [Alphaproteobacteria bacterium]|nr:hypothetical protein [Alphaproteobacteria bacterium]